MATPAQILANRQNSTLSTGPVTAEGKAIASAKFPKTRADIEADRDPGEDPAEYDALRESIVKQYVLPTKPSALWSKKSLPAPGVWREPGVTKPRSSRNSLATTALDADAAYAELFFEKPKELQRLLRYVTTIERAYYRALNKLEKLQKERKQEEKESASTASWTEPMQTRRREIGSVSQNAKVAAVSVPAQAPASENSHVRARAA